LHEEDERRRQWEIEMVRKRELAAKREMERYITEVGDDAVREQTVVLSFSLSLSLSVSFCVLT
jgi:hypothetical protein